MTIGYFLIYAIVAIVAGLFLMVPLAIVFDWMHWRHFNAWALAHGSWLLAWPALTVVSFFSLAFLGERLRKWKHGDGKTGPSR